jgi:hypothetical protein
MGIENKKEFPTKFRLQMLAIQPENYHALRLSG